MNRQLATFNAAEYRVKISHFTRQGFDIDGVIHVGASDGYEVEHYINLGIENILLFEPLPSACKILHERYPQVPVVQLALSDVNTTKDLQVTEGSGAGSSFLDMIDDSGIVQSWDDNKYVVEKIKAKVSRFDTWANKNNYFPGNYDCLVMDVQGLELKALWGFGEYLKGFKYLNIECSEIPVYQGEAPAKTVIKYLEKQGFVQDSPIEPHNDVMFIRKDIKAESDKIYRGLA